MKNNTVPPASENNLNRLRVTMNEIRTRYPTTSQLSTQDYATSAKGSFRDCMFYVSDGENRTGMAFRVAYNAAKQTKNNKELCASVGSMICEVFTGFRRPVEAALKGIGVTPLLVWLPSEAAEHDIEEADVPQMDWPSILVYFGCCILLLLKKTGDLNYETFMSTCIRELQGRAGCDPDAHLDIPFDLARANAIRIMLGASSNLRASAIRFLMGAGNRGDSGISGVCRHLCNVLSWSEMGAFTLMKELLVKPQSPVLHDPRVSWEVDNLTEAFEAIASHPQPQFFMHLASNLELFKVDPSRFPTLVAVAKELEFGYCSTVANCEAVSTAGARSSLVQTLVNLHRNAIPLTYY